MKVTLKSNTIAPINTIDGAAANCYDTDITADNYKEGRLMRQCANSGHLAVLEFADFVFHVEGVSRALLAQITRHRLASFAVRSQRYCSEDGFQYVTPKTICKSEEALAKYNACMDYLRHTYADLQELGIPNEDARMILPNACYTTLEVKMNLRELMHFMNERLCNRAQWEIRELALEMKKCVIAQYPELADYLVPKCEKNKMFMYCPEHKCCGKHPKLKDIVEKIEKK